MRPVLSIACSEISLKGKNRPSFEHTLMHNMAQALSPLGRFSLVERGGRIIAAGKADFDSEAAKRALSRTFGVDNVAVCLVAKPDIEDISRLALSFAPELAGHSMKVEAKRSDKRFPMTSQEVGRAIGALLVEKGCSVDLENPEKTLYVDILSDMALVYTQRVKGPAGLPVGSSGKVLSLLSGGIDSPVASWLMMKRGCQVDFLHVHNGEAKDQKIIRIAEALRNYSPRKTKLVFAPYTEFYKKTMEVDPRYETIVFRRFLFRLASAFAAEHGHKAMVTGDSVGQVASQTVENIFATDSAADVPVFRPLVGFNKQEIIDLAIKIGTYDMSLEEYKDCCSLVSGRNPSTSVPLDIALRIEEQISMKDIVEKTLGQCETVEI
jgi:thiamine biosynthesis protein ThiI